MQGTDMHTKNGRSKPCSLRLGHTKPFAGMLIGVLGCFSAWGGHANTYRPSPPLGYSDVVTETRKHESFAVSERPTPNKVVFRCRIPDDCIDKNRYPLFMARAVLQELIESLQLTTGSAKP